MATSITQAIEKFNPVKGEGSILVVGVATDVAGQQYSSKLLELAFNADPADPETISFEWNSLTFIFEFNGDPNDSGEEIEGNTGALALGAYVDTVVEALSKNLEIITNFIITSNTGGSPAYIYLTPKNEQFAPSFTVLTQGTNVILSETTTANLTYQANRAVLLVTEIYNRYTDQYDILFTDIINPGIASNNAYFDISTHFDLKHHFPSTTDISDSAGVSGTFDIHECTENLIPFKLKHGDYYGDPPSPKILVEDATTFYAWYAAKMHKDRLGGFNLNGAAELNFLTLQPRNKFIDPDQVDFLYVAGKDTPDLDFSVRVTYYFLDNTNGVKLFTTTQVAEHGKIYYFPIRKSLLGVVESVLNPITRFWVDIIDNGTDEVTGESFNYFLQPAGMSYTKYFAIGNSFGCVDFIRGTGKVTTSPRYEWKEANRELLTTTDNADAIDTRDTAYNKIIQYDKKETPTFKGNIGHHDEDFIDYLREMLLSNEVRLLENELYVPILINTNSVNLKKDDDDLFSLEFEYRHAFEEYGLIDNSKIT